MHKLNAMYLAMLNNMWDIENQLTVLLPKLAAHAHGTELKKVLSEHLEETRQQKLRIEELLAHHGRTLTYERDMAFEILLQDTSSELALLSDQSVKDAFIAASAQTAEHIEISRYTTLLSWATKQGDEIGMRTLQETLQEEKAASEKLIAIAESGSFASE